MHGLISKILATEGGREELIETLRRGTAEMPGCLSYVIARDPGDDVTIWVTEVWESPEKHAASLQLPAVQEAIAAGRRMIAGMEQVAVTQPVAGHGLEGLDR